MINSKFKVIIAESMADDGINLLRYDPNFEVIVLDKSEKEKLVKEISDAHAIIVRSGVKVTKDLISSASNLKIVGRAGAGYDNIDVEACSEKGIAVMIAPTGNTNGVVEITIGLLFSLIRHIPKADHTMKSGIWAKKNLEGTELKGKTIGLVGLGKIGGRVAEICLNLGMNVLAVVNDKNKKREIQFRGEFVDTIDDLLPHVDFLSIHIPLNDSTRDMIKMSHLEKMKPSSFLINTSRGAIVNENDLYDAVKANKIAGAAIDVYSQEPASKEQFPFIELENIIALPHLGASTKESQSNVSRIICENIMEALKSNIFIDAVNLSFGIQASLAKEYRPFIILAKRMGQLIGQYLYTPIIKMEINHRISVISGILDINPILMTLSAEVFGAKNPNVSLVNIDEFLKENAIDVKIQTDRDTSYDNSIRVKIECSDGYNFELKGTFIAGVPMIVEIQKIMLDVVLAGKMLIIRNLNVPGVIGEIGTLLGNKGINIAEMHLGRSDIGGETKGAIMVDEDVSKSILDELKNLKNIIDVKMINFEF